MKVPEEEYTYGTALAALAHYAKDESEDARRKEVHVLAMLCLGLVIRLSWESELMPSNEEIRAAQTRFRVARRT